MNDSVLRHRVREGIKARIAGGTFRPGEKLPQHQLATEFGVSRGVVREAILELDGLGLVRSIDNRGAVVQEVGPAELLEAYEMREMLDGLAARLCCERIALKELRELRELIAEMHKHHKTGWQREGALLNREFNRRLIVAAGNTLLIRLSEACWFVNKVATGKGADAEGTLRRLSAVLDAIEAGDAEGAEKSARLAVRSGREFFVERLKDPEFQIEWLQ